MALNFRVAAYSVDHMVSSPHIERAQRLRLSRYAWIIGEVVSLFTYICEKVYLLMLVFLVILLCMSSILCSASAS